MPTSSSQHARGVKTLKLRLALFCDHNQAGNWTKFCKFPQDLHKINFPTFNFELLGDGWPAHGPSPVGPRFTRSQALIITPRSEVEKVKN